MMKVPNKWIGRMRDYINECDKAIDSEDLMQIRIKFSSLEWYLSSIEKEK